MRDNPVTGTAKDLRTRRPIEIFEPEEIRAIAEAARTGLHENAAATGIPAPLLPASRRPCCVRVGEAAQPALPQSPNDYVFCRPDGDPLDSLRRLQPKLTTTERYLHSKPRPDDVAKLTSIFA